MPHLWRPLYAPVLMVVALYTACMLAEAPAVERFDYHSVRRAAVPSQGRFEGETHFLKHGNARLQGMGHYGQQWSGNAHFLWDGKIGDEAQVEFRIPRTSRFHFTMQLTRAVDYGVFQVRLDGKPIGQPIDLFSTRVELAPLADFGKLQLDEGNHKLTFQLVRGNKQAKKFNGTSFLLGLDYFQLKDLQPPEPVNRLERGVPAVEVPAPATAQALLAKYCVRCHRGDKAQGNVTLTEMHSLSTLQADIETAEKIADAVAFANMPPADERQPSKGERAQLTRYFHDAIDAHVAQTNTVAPTVMRRMNRYEYNNSVRDLLNLRGDIYPLPERTLRSEAAYFDPATGQLPDVISVGNRTLGKNQVERQILEGVVPFAIDLQSEHGFNNRGDELSLSPILLETFVKLGQSIVNSPQFSAYCRDYDAIFTGSHPRDAKHDLELASERLGELLERAFREPVDKETRNRYIKYFKHEYGRSGSFAKGMKETVAGIIASPKFLYIVEKAASSRVSRLTDYELATRLAFFLWSTIPDQELLELARSNKLQDAGVLEAQVERMLLSPKCRALSENFARQWLRLDQLITAVPDMERFPTYYSRIGCEQWKFGLQTMVEPLLLFESILVEDRSIMLLIDSQYSYRSDELQSWYTEKVPFNGKENVNRFNTNRQNYMRRDLATRREGGVLTSAAILTMTSSPLRTSPITRGAWVATVMLNRPPEPPPDVVPEIEADDNAIEAQGITLRERLKLHQTKETCAACHAKIDPLGFVLENYDAVGRWRDTYRSGLPIDASGKLFGDVKFRDIESFKDALLDHPTVFMRGFTEHLFAYAMSRELQPADRPAIDRIVRRVHEHHGRLSTVVQEIIKSRPFRHKSNQQTDTTHGDAQE